jgi:prepilin-type N-terminal cleavage/methylation domain-containing protein
MLSPAETVNRYGEAPPPRLLRAAGFTMLELMVVLAMAMTATTIAVPTMVNVVANARLHRSMANLSSLYQNGRTLAVRGNSITRIRYQLINNNWTAFVDDGVNPSGLTSTVPQLSLPVNFSKVAPPSGSAPTPLDDATCGSTITPDTTDDTYFNQLGVPCQYSSGTCSSSQAYAYYFTQKGSMNISTTWAAMCVSPAGRVKAWYWTGSGWTN